MGVNYHHLTLVEKIALNSLMVWVVHNLAGPTPTTFSAAIDTLSYLEREFECGSKVWVHLPPVHLVILTSSVFTFLVLVRDTVQKLILYCVMSQFGPGHDSEGSTGFWRVINQTTSNVYKSITIYPSQFTYHNLSRTKMSTLRVWTCGLQWHAPLLKIIMWFLQSIATQFGQWMINRKFSCFYLTCWLAKFGLQVLSSSYW